MEPSEEMLARPGSNGTQPDRVDASQVPKSFLGEWPQSLLRGAAVAVAYVVFARLGYALSVPQSVVALWPPAGIMLGLLALNSFRVWPSIVAGGVIGCMITEALSGQPLSFVIEASLANNVESVLAAWVLRRLLGDTPLLSSVRAILTLVVGAVVLSNAVSALLGGLVIHRHSGMPFPKGWLIWWLGDGLGMLIVTPVLLLWRERTKVLHLVRARWVEGLILLTTLGTLAQLTMGAAFSWLPVHSLLLVFPFMAWAALRFGPAGASTASFVIGIVALGNSALGRGPFTSGGNSGALAAIEIYTIVGVAALSSLVWAAVLEERESARRRRTEAEERMRFALEAARVGFWDVDLRTGEARWSEMLEQLHGLRPGKFQNTYQAFVDLIDERDRDAVLAEVERATRHHNDSHIAYRTTWPDGSLHWIAGVGRTVYDASGVPIRAAGIGMETTELRALEEQYRQAQKMEAIGQLAGGVAHDFNNLLSAIQGYGTLVLESIPADSQAAADVQEMLTAAQRGASLTRQLLAFSRKQIVEPRVLDLGACLRSTESMLHRLLGEDVELTLIAAEDLGRVTADPGQIEQAVLNLTVNARDAMPAGGTLLLEAKNVTASTRLHIDVPAGRYVMIAVTDTGVGMDAATIARIFEPFFTTKPQGKGTGLGLATVHGIVKQLGGSIQVYSEPGIGTTFKLYLPRVDDALDARAETPVDIPAFGSGTVLVAEDNEALRTLARRLLEDQGYRVLAAATPLAALRLADGHDGPIALLITDVVLPEMSGRELAEQLVARRPGLPVLFMSGYTDDAIVRTGILSHDTHFIQKPFTPVDFLQKVQSVLAIAASSAGT
jgi:signal transduction histidine kinase/integral membrane sensor domain MASE1